MEFHELHGQIEVPLNIRSVHDIDDALWLFREDVGACDQFFAAVRGHRINAGKISDECIRITFDHAVLAVDRNARKVADMLIRSGQAVKQCRFSAILVSGECKGQRLCFGKRMLFLFAVIFAALTETRMRDRFFSFFFRLS